MISSWGEIRKWLAFPWQLADFHHVLQGLGKPKPILSGPEEQGWRCGLKAGQWRMEFNPSTESARMLDTDTWTAIYCPQNDMLNLLSLFLREQTGMAGDKTGKIGLVLAGGGAKGAYQIGVWQALQELGLEARIEGISGTSIGAVNAMLFARGDCGYAHELWLRFCDSSFRQEQRDRIEKFKRNDDPALGPFIQKMANGFFISQPELENALLKAADGYEERLRKKYHIFSTVTRMKAVKLPDHIQHPQLKNAVYVPWGVLRKRDMVSAALASAAVPIMYNPVTFRNVEYYDGGLADNIPFQPLYDCGYRRFIVVHLMRRNSGQVSDAIRQLEKYQDCRAVHIIPGEGFQDDLSAMLQLTREAVEERMARGYREAMEHRRDMESLLA